MKRRSGIKVMGQLIGLVVPLLHVMTAAILLGVAGFLCAIFLSILAGSGLVYGIMEKAWQVFLWENCLDLWPYSQS